MRDRGVLGSDRVPPAAPQVKCLHTEQPYNATCGFCRQGHMWAQEGVHDTDHMGLAARQTKEEWTLAWSQWNSQWGAVFCLDVPQNAANGTK